ncbi:hypothetical protein [Acetobacter indonesiensis]|uniref:Uncharacterized protein n=1 Tax=Acetobacter indonesiensis TaxID=104101 RepID=A0A252AXZ8_9PROT|nr:hypothetical protein [Acetobacter indonesiensis]OUI96319.1 hypothetical protein HK17_11895 [Acetobacter indonesiensis]
MSLFAETRLVSDAALERARSAGQLISLLGPLLDPTIEIPSAIQAARVQRAALRLVDAALEENGADATRYVGFGIAALYVGMRPSEFDAICTKGKGPSCTLVEGKALFKARDLDAWLENLKVAGSQ